MRDPKRIDKFCEELAKEWHKVPDWRFGQLIYNVFAGRDPFYFEEEMCMEHIKKVIGEVVVDDGE